MKQEIARSGEKVEAPPKGKVAVTGASGLLGRRLMPALDRAGWSAQPLVRRREQPGIFWDPAGGMLDPSALGGYSAVIHLAGENVFGRWTASKKRRIEESRVRGTRLIAESLAALDAPPSVLISASAIGFYGDRGDELMRESSTKGEGFLADVCGNWEAATAAASEAGMRVVHLRIGIVLDKDGGALAQMLTPFKLGVGGQLGDGRQWFSWIHVDDLVAAILFALENEEVSGPVNGVAPAPVRNRELTKTLGRVLGRPTLLPAPSLALKLAFGQMANETLLASTRVSPDALEAAGFRFQHGQLESALRAELD